MNRRVSRREFLGSSARWIAAGLALPSFTAVARAAAVTPADAPAPSRRVFADLHVHSLMNDWIARSAIARANPMVRRFGEQEVNVTRAPWPGVHAARIDVLLVAHYNVFDEVVSMPTDPNVAAPATTLRMLDLLERTVAEQAAPFAALARNRTELDRLLEVPRDDPRFRVAVVHTIEGGHALGGDIAFLERLAHRGVACMTLTHFFNKGIGSSANALPFFPDANSEWPKQGLSPYGREVVAEMERLGMICDVTHLSATAVADFLRFARRPCLASHTAARAVADHPYSLYDEHIQEIARNGGLIGIVIYPYAHMNVAGNAWTTRAGSLREVVRTVRHVVKICGTHRHVGLGSDFGGYIEGPREMRDLGQIRVLRRMLLQEFGGDEDVVEDIMASNAIRFLREHWRTGATSG